MKRVLKSSLLGLIECHTMIAQCGIYVGDLLNIQSLYEQYFASNLVLNVLQKSVRLLKGVRVFIMFSKIFVSSVFQGCSLSYGTLIGYKKFGFPFVCDFSCANFSSVRR